MGSNRSAVRGAPPEVVVTSADVPVVPSAHPQVPGPARRRVATVPAQGRTARRHAARRPDVRRPDATGPLSLVPRRRRSPAARAVRAVAFPAVVVAVLALGGWETHRLVAAQQPTTSVIISPTVAASWGRAVVLHSTTGSLAGGGYLVDVSLRLIGPGRFDPATVTLRAPDGAQVAVSYGATRPVRLVAGRPVEGHLGFVVVSVDGPLTLVARDADGVEHLVPVRPGVLSGADPASLPPTWTRTS